MTAQQIEIAVANHFGYRRNLIVPNVHWGIGLNYEADMVVLRPSDWAIEVEIKVTASDIKADTKKRHQHNSRLFRQLYFAVPAEISGNPYIPTRAGLLSVETDKYGGHKVKELRAPATNRNAVKWKPETRQKLHELAAMRIWSLKEHLAMTAKRKGMGNV